MLKTDFHNVLMHTFKKNKTNPDKAKDPHKITNVIGHPESLKRASKKSQIAKNISASFESDLKKNLRDNDFSRLQAEISIMRLLLKETPVYGQVLVY